VPQSPAGSLNKNTLESKKIIEEALKSGISPLQYMLNIMRDKKADKARRDDMAKAAAPYLHPRLQAIEHSGTINNSAADPHELDDTELEVIARAGRSGAVAAAPGSFAQAIDVPGRPQTDGPDEWLFHPPVAGADHARPEDRGVLRPGQAVEAHRSGRRSRGRYVRRWDRCAPAWPWSGRPGPP
jgi:hypothetical protein